MGALGEMLRQARLDRGASLADAERETHIRRKYLEALESEDYGSLPALVYARGFIRSYARFLGIDPELAIDLFAPARAREERPLLRPATPRLTGGRPISARVFMVVAGVILAALLISYLWTQYNSFVESLGQADQASPAVAARTPTRAAAVSSPSPSETADRAAPPASSTPAPAVAGPIATPERGVVVEARVSERTWMEVWTDGTPQLQASLQGGATRNFTANQSVRMRVGNAGAVQVTVNGEPKGVLGEKNQVKDFVWER